MAITWVYQVARARGFFLSEDHEHLSLSMTSRVGLFVGDVISVPVEWKLNGVTFDVQVKRNQGQIVCGHLLEMFSVGKFVCVNLINKWINLKLVKQAASMQKKKCRISVIISFISDHNITFSVFYIVHT